MKEIVSISTVSEAYQFLNLGKPKHPLISVLRLGNVLGSMDIDNLKYSIGLYQISLKDNCPFTIANYGRNSYDYQEGTMIFTAPNQVVEYKKSENYKEDKGWTLLFHPDLIRKSELCEKISKFSFFNYASNEALHLSDEERKTVTQIVEKIETEFSNNIDTHSQTLIISNLELLLNYLHVSI